MSELGPTLAWVVSGTSLLTLWLMGNRWKWAPLVGVGTQVFWITFVVVSKQWGLLPGVIGYTVIHVRNTIKWAKLGVNK